MNEKDDELKNNVKTSGEDEFAGISENSANVESEFNRDNTNKKVGKNGKGLYIFFTILIIFILSGFICAIVFGIKAMNVISNEKNNIVENVVEKKDEMTKEQREAVEEVQQDVNKAMNGSEEDKQEVIDKYKNKAEEALENSGVNMDDVKSKAQDQLNDARARMGL